MSCRKALAVVTLLCLSSASCWADEAEQPVNFSKRTADNRAVADQYISAYFDKRWDALAELSGESLNFKDPTGALIWGEAPERDGKTKVLDVFRTGYAPLEMKFNQIRAVYSGDHAIYEGDLDWTYHLPKRDIRSVTPMVTILRLADGKVVEHRDYVDYQPFIDAEVASRPEPAGG